MYTCVLRLRASVRAVLQAKAFDTPVSCVVYLRVVLPLLLRVGLGDLKGFGLKGFG